MRYFRILRKTVKPLQFPLRQGNFNYNYVKADMRFCALVERHSLNTRTLFIAVNEGYIKETFYMKYIFLSCNSDGCRDRRTL